MFDTSWLSSLQLQLVSCVISSWKIKGKSSPFYPPNPPLFQDMRHRVLWDILFLRLYILFFEERCTTIIHFWSSIALLYWLHIIISGSPYYSMFVREESILLSWQDNDRIIIRSYWFDPILTGGYSTHTIRTWIVFDMSNHLVFDTSWLSSLQLQLVSCLISSWKIKVKSSPFLFAPRKFPFFG